MDTFCQRMIGGAATVDEVLSGAFEAVPGRKSTRIVPRGAWPPGAGPRPAATGRCLSGGWPATG